MKKNISVIRESIGRIVSMLTMQSVKVTMRGTSAHVSYHPTTGAITGMNIPFIPDDASDEFVSAIQGFLDHEVGHVLYSCSKTLIEANKEGKRIANLANIIEDVYIERKMMEGFQGSGTNLESVRGFYLNKIALPKITAALAAGDTETARGYATVAAFRGWGGQASAADFIKQPKIAALVKSVHDKLGPELVAELSLCNSSQDCLKLARRFKAKLEEPVKPETKSPKKGKGESSPAADPEDSPKDKEFGDKGTRKTEKDDSGKKRETEELEAIDTDESEAGDSTGASGSDSKTSSEEDEEEKDKKEKPSKPPTSPDSTEAEADAAPAKSDNLGLGIEGNGEGEGDEVSAEAAAGGEDAEGAGEPSDSAADKPAGGTGKEDTKPALRDPLADMFDTARDFDKDVGEKLSKDAGKEVKGSSYAIFSTEWDRIAPAPLAKYPASVVAMEAAIKDKLGVMQKQLERGVAAQARKAWSSNQSRGRIAPGSLYKVSLNDDRVFRQRRETQAKNTAISLVLDCSGSMACGRMKLAGLAAFALSSVLDRLRITHEVIGFSTSYSGEMIHIMDEDEKLQHEAGNPSPRWSRVEPLYMPVFKPFAGKLDTAARSRLAHLSESPSWLCQNVDGESVQIAARRLVKQRAERHIMMVLSDGEPCASVSRGLSAHLVSTVAGLEKQGVEVIGIGIQTEAVANFYPKHVVLYDAAELPTRVMTELTRLLLAS